MAHAGGRPRAVISFDDNDLPEQAYFTVAEIVARTGITRETIQARLKDGTIAGKKIGKTWRIYRDSLIKNG